MLTTEDVLNIVFLKEINISHAIYFTSIVCYVWLMSITNLFLFFFTLLFFRKTCQSCKCPREAHAIYQQQSTTVHERLGFKVVSPADSGVDPRDLGYTWVPQGIRVSSRINRYFEQLPLEKVPKIGSEGARYREQQISYQLPKQDLSLEHCKHLEDVHEASYEDFVTARNEIALDIGKGVSCWIIVERHHH